MRVVSVTTAAADHLYRAPMKFAGVAVDRVTVLTATVTVEAPGGRSASGTSSMPLGNVWAFPSPRHTTDQTLAAMRAVADAVADAYEGSKLVGHPVEITHALEAEFFAAADRVAARLNLSEPIPHLATLVAASPIDAALHDAFGKLHGASAYHLLGPDALPGDLARFLGPDFAGRTLDQFVTHAPRPALPLYHLVGALDPLTPADVTAPAGDTLPDSLAEWVRADGLTHLKVKLDGADAAWDFARITAIDRVVAEVQDARGVPTWVYSLDFNERCPSPDALVEFLNRLRRDAPAAFARVQYVEQPLPRDLFTGAGAADIRAAAKLVPVVVDESLTDLSSLTRAVELGYSGAAFKACKGQTQSLLLAAAAQHRGLFRCVQDLTCPGAALIHSAGLAARLPGVVAIEANARQYVPAANAGWDARFPGLFTTRTGTLATGQLTGAGLGA